jgi:anti-sigma regulatory factor (Ser/Thr protein kinase)
LIRPPVRLPITEPTQASEARRTATELARTLGFTDVPIAVTETGTNLAKHAIRGEILLSAEASERHAALDMLAIDHGPGMDLERCLRDGYSTAGTSGTGFGAIHRLATTFDAWSDSSGTVLLARFERERRTPAPFVVGAARAAKHGETACGDGWFMKCEGSHLGVLVADGLGHGQLAADAAIEAASVFHSQTFRGAADMVRLIHAGLRGTRGAAVAVASIDSGDRRIRYSGLGNVAGVVVHSAGTQSLISLNGTAGHQASKISEFEYPWPAGSLLVMHTDGLATSWRLDRYPGLVRRHPAVIAGVLYRDYNRGRDDVTVVVISDSVV